MKAKVIKQAKILVANKDHQNFIEKGDGEFIDVGTVIDGQEQYINGLRRGEPFTYKLFVTKDKKIVFLNTIEPIMNNVEVLLNADGPTPTETYVSGPKMKRIFFQSVGLGALAGIGIAEYQKKSLKTAALYAVVGMAIGYGVGKLIANNQSKTK